jgi:beta-galactosidase
VERWASDLDAMSAASVNALRVGDFAWGRLEPRENQWDFAWLDHFLSLAHGHDIRILLIPPLRCAPAWLVAKDPTIQIVNEAGVRLEFGSRYTFCINHPLLMAKGLAVTERMARRYAEHPAVMGWHLDNEYGDEPDCHCEVCRAQWHGWLRQNYGDIAQLNRAWGTAFWSLQFLDFAQVPTPKLTKTHHNPALLLAWRRFRSQCTVDLMRQQAQVCRSCNPQLPVTTNLQCLWNPRTDYFALRGLLDVAGMNYYPPYGEGTRDNALGMAVVRGCVGPGFHIHELRNSPHAVPGRANNTPAPGEIERLTLHTVANGADAVFYFQWAGVPFGAEQTHGAIVDYDGRPRRAYAECQRIGEKLRNISPLLAGTAVRSDIAVIYDFPTRWLMLSGEEWLGPPDLYLNHARKLYNVIRELGVNCAAVGRAGDWAGYRLLIVPMLDCINDALVQKLIHYVESGGVLVWHPLSGIRNQDAEIYPTRLHPELEGLFGLRVREYATAGADEKRALAWNGRTYGGEWFMDLPERSTAKVVATYGEGWMDGTPAVCENAVGLGRAVYCTTFAEAEFYRDFFAQLIGEAGVRPILGGAPPAAIEVTERSHLDGRRLVFLINTTRHRQTMELNQPWYDVWNDEPMSGQVVFPPWGVRIGLARHEGTPITPPAIRSHDWESSRTG